MATDKRLDQVSTLTDFDYALIVKGDQVAKASKQQLAELVGNLLYGATNASSLATVVAEHMGFIIYSNVLNAGESVTLNKGYGMLIIDNISNGKSSVYGIGNGYFDLLSSKDETGITISYVSEYVTSLTNMNNTLVTLQVRII